MIFKPCKIKNKKAFNLLILLALFILFNLFKPIMAEAKRDNKLPVVNIGRIIDGEYEKNEEIFKLFKKEILDLTKGEFDVRFPEDKSIIADWTVKSIRSSIDSLIKDSGVDILITFGVISSHIACSIEDIPKPVIAPFIIDIKLQGISHKGNTSGVSNLSYVVISSPTDESFKVFHNIFPFKKIVYLDNKYYFDAIPDLRERISDAVAPIGSDVEIIPIGETTDTLFKSIPKDTDAIFLAPLFSMPHIEFTKLILSFNERRIPTFSHFRREDIELGVFAGIVPKAFFPRISRRVALNLQRILLGEPASDLPVTFPQEEILIINMATARTIGVWPSWETLTEAELINEHSEVIERRLNFIEVIQKAIKINLDLAAKDKSIIAGMQRIREARSKLFPHFDISATGTQIDEDRAQASFGTQPERSLSSSATLNQVIYSEKAIANVKIQHHLLKSIENEREQLRLDIALEAALAYLDILKAKTNERIVKENLKLTKANLDIARRRQAIGVSGPAEIYRWEAQIATSRQAVIKAEANRRLAETDLNRILNRPLEERFLIAEVDFNDPNLTTTGDKLNKYTDNPWTFKIFRDFLAQESIQNSYELRVIDEAIAAQERSLISAKRAFWSPTLALQGSVREVISKSGAGVESDLSGGMLSGFSDLFPQTDDTNWSIALNLSFPLYSGGYKNASQKKAEEEVTKLILMREATKDRIEQRTRSALHSISISLPNINLSRDAAEAAKKNFELVTDAYSSGAVSIIELLDAQNASFVANQVAENSGYDYLIDLMKAKRAVGSMDFFATTKEREEWFIKLNNYFKEKGINYTQ